MPRRRGNLAWAAIGVATALAAGVSVWWLWPITASSPTPISGATRMASAITSARMSLRHCATRMRIGANTTSDRFALNVHLSDDRNNRSRRPSDGQATGRPSSSASNGSSGGPSYRSKILPGAPILWCACFWIPSKSCAQCHQSDVRRHRGARGLRGIPSALNSPPKKEVGRPVRYR